MVAVIGVLQFSLLIRGARSLKDKRRVLRSLKDRYRSRYNLSVAEVDDQSLQNKATLAMAMAAQRSGKGVGVVFTGDALYRLCTGVVQWPDSLSGMEVRKTISKGAKEMGLSIASSRDPRELDVGPLLEETRRAGVTLYACPLWSRLLKLTNTLPEWLSEIEMDRFVEEIVSSPKVIGSL